MPSRKNVHLINNALWWILPGAAVAYLLFSAKKEDSAKMGYQQILEILNAQIGQGFWQVYDPERWKISHAVMQKILDETAIDKGEYNDRHDCNSFAFELKGYMARPGLSHLLPR